jgi:CO dehydrogenase maturation factor
MEHLSRRTTHKVDLLLIISDPTQKGIQTAKRINGLVDELALDMGRRELIVNRVSDENFDKLKNVTVGLPLENVFNVPEDDNIFHLDLEGKPVFDLPADSIAVKTVYGILDSCRIP